MYTYICPLIDTLLMFMDIIICILVSFSLVSYSSPSLFSLLLSLHLSLSFSLCFYLYPSPLLDAHASHSPHQRLRATAGPSRSQTKTQHPWQRRAPRGSSCLRPRAR